MRALLQLLEKSSIEKVWIYNGKGSSSESAHRLGSLFRQLNLKWEVGYLAPRENLLKPDPDRWERGKTLFIMPGGQCSYWDEELGSCIEKIRRFVEEGGFFLGICAGGYFASSCSSYKWEVDKTTIKKRSLSLFLGQARGPLFLDLLNRDSTRVPWKPKAVGLKWCEETKTVPVLVLGGPDFIPESPDQVEVLATLEHKRGCSNAIVKTQVGKGVSILLSWHPENGSDSIHLEAYTKLFPRYNWSKIQEKLREGDPLRIALFARILSEFSLQKPSKEPLPSML